MNAWHVAQPAEFNNFLDLGQREAQPLRLLDELKELDHGLRVEPVSVFASLGLGKRPIVS